MNRRPVVVYNRGGNGPGGPRAQRRHSPPAGTYTFGLQQTRYGHTLTPIVPELEVREGQLVQLEL
ncbi:MAG: hypothetical protein PHN82_01880 [bacterium]|nr:hypothetical protein [bacterium]